MSSLAEELPKEIERVIAVRSQYEALRGLSGVVVEPAIMLMSGSISRAIRASAAGDVVEMIRAYEDLKGYDV